jgi:hypothetical protein
LGLIRWMGKIEYRKFSIEMQDATEYIRDCLPIQMLENELGNFGIKRCSRPSALQVQQYGQFANHIAKKVKCPAHHEILIKRMIVSWLKLEW